MRVSMIYLAVSLVLGVFCAPAVRADFINGSLETGDFSGWTVVAHTANGGSDVGVLLNGTLAPHPSDSGPYFVHASNGLYGGYATVAGWHGQFVSLEQSVMLLPGRYTASFDLRGDGTTWHGPWANGSSISVNGVTHAFPCCFNPITSAFHTYSDTFDSLGGLTDFVFHITGSGTASVGLSFDNFRLRLVPEPASIALFATGLIGLMLARRRQPPAGGPLAV